MDYRAPFWLQNPHVQSVGAALPWHASPRAVAAILAGGEEERGPIPLPDRDGEPQGQLLAQVFWQARTLGPRPAVVVIHGVGGSSESRYVVRAALALYDAGFHAVRLNLRSAGQGMGLARGLYHAGLTEDLDATVRDLAKDPRVSRVGLLGFSLGGNLALKAAGEWGTSPSGAPPGLAAVVSVSAPTNLDVVGKGLERHRAYVYRHHILRSLAEQARRFKTLWPSRAPYDLGELGRARTLRRYDDLVVAPMYGFADAGAYYAASSSGPFLPQVRVPTLALHADDDPLVPGATVRPDLVHASKAVQVVVSARGGHVGWVTGLGRDHWHRTWALRRAIDFFGEGFR